MATFDYPSDLVHRIPYPAIPRPGRRIDLRVAALPAEEEETKHAPIPPRRQVEEDSLFREIESGARLGRNPLAGAGALALQCLLLLALIVIPLFRTDPLPKRETLTMLYLQPPSAAGSVATNLQAPKLASTYIPAASTGITAPVDKTQEAPPPPVSTMGGVVGGVPGGTVGGVPGGAFGEMLNSAPSVPVLAKSPVPTPLKRMRIASRVAEANLIHDVAPQYPPEAGRARIEGTVVLMAVIGTDGTVKDVRIESGLPILAQAAIDAVKQWRYKPYMIDGEPVEVDSRITINFTLSAS
ncbi:MAG: TonB family protein [Terriglobales bacterium]